MPANGNTNTSSTVDVCSTTLSINCPIGPAQPGATVTATGTTPDCATTTGNVSVDGVDIPSTFTCDNGRFELSAKAPACGSGQNVMRFEVACGDDSDSCLVPIDCDC